MFKLVLQPSQPIGDHPLWQCPLRVVSNFVRHSCGKPNNKPIYVLMGMGFTIYHPFMVILGLVYHWVLDIISHSIIIIYSTIPIPP